MNTHVSRLTAALALTLSGAMASAQDFDDDEFRFHAHLSGAQEVVPPDAPTTPSPGVNTQGAALFAMQASENLAAIRFRLAASSLSGVTQAHLHCGRAGENGPIVVPLIPPNDQGADVSGIIGQGTLTNEQIAISAAECEQVIGRPVRNVASLIAAAYEGLIYANVHTVTNPAGEVRGQLVPGDDDDIDDDDFDDDDDDDDDDDGLRGQRRLGDLP